MSQFTSSIANAKSGASAYTAAILAMLGDQDPLEVLRQTPGALTRAVAGMSPRGLVQQETPGKWSVLQVIQHLTDSELVVGYRVRLILTVDRPEIVGYDQDRWVATVHRADTNVTELIERLAVLRKGNLQLVESTTSAERQRVGIHSERGEESIALIIRLLGGHDLVHLRQLDRIKTVVGA